MCSQFYSLTRSLMSCEEYGKVIDLRTKSRATVEPHRSVPPVHRNHHPNPSG